MQQGPGHLPGTQYEREDMDMPRFTTFNGTFNVPTVNYVAEIRRRVINGVPFSVSDYRMEISVSRGKVTVDTSFVGLQLDNGQVVAMSITDDHLPDAIRQVRDRIRNEITTGHTTDPMLMGASLIYRF
jgi:hypothetical protein